MDSIACSSDGSKVYLGSPSHIYRSTDYLLSHALSHQFPYGGQTGAGLQLTTNSDGTKVYVGHSEHNYVMVSLSSGVSGTYTYTSNSVIFGNAPTNWKSIATSADGSKVFGVGTNVNMRFSSDSGTTFHLYPHPINPNGTVVTASATTYFPCTAGRYALAGATVCSPCTAGLTSQAGSSVCSCPPGNVLVGGVCITCGAGTSAPYGSNRCITCSAGYSGDGRVCTLCVAGTFSPTVGSSICIKCPPGSYSSSGATKCPSCSSSYYALTSNEGSGTCGCSPGYRAIAHTGYTFGMYCSGCSPGTYTNTIDYTPAASGYYNNMCKLCPIGSYSVRGDHGWGGGTGCHMMTKRQYTLTGDAAEECPIGGYVHSDYFYGMGTNSMVCSTCDWPSQSNCDIDVITYFYRYSGYGYSSGNGQSQWEYSAYNGCDICTRAGIGLTPSDMATTGTCVRGGWVLLDFT